jgi:hypothetical protein
MSSYVVLLSWLGLEKRLKVYELKIISMKIDPLWKDGQVIYFER